MVIILIRRFIIIWKLFSSGRSVYQHANIFVLFLYSFGFAEMFELFQFWIVLKKIYGNLLIYIQCIQINLFVVYNSKMNWRNFQASIRHHRTEMHCHHRCLKLQRTACRECRTSWKNWSSCSMNWRSRSEIVIFSFNAACEFCWGPRISYT